MLEPNAWKLARSVLRGERSSDAPDLPDKNHAQNLLLWLFLCRYVARTLMRSGLLRRHWRECAVPGLTAEDCPNKEVCGTIIQLTEEERAELYTARMENNRRVVETVMMSPSLAAQRLLRDYAPRTPKASRLSSNG